MAAAGPCSRHKNTDHITLDINQTKPIADTLAPPPPANQLPKHLHFYFYLETFHNAICICWSGHHPLPLGIAYGHGDALKQQQKQNTQHRCNTTASIHCHDTQQELRRHHQHEVCSPPCGCNGCSLTISLVGNANTSAHLCKIRGVLVIVAYSPALPSCGRSHSVQPSSTTQNRLMPAVGK